MKELIMKRKEQRLKELNLPAHTLDHKISRHSQPESTLEHKNALKKEVSLMVSGLRKGLT